MTLPKGAIGRAQAGFLGSLRDALAAAGRADGAAAGNRSSDRASPSLEVINAVAPVPAASNATQLLPRDNPLPAAADAARDARGGTPVVPPLTRAAVETTVEELAAATTRVVRGATPLKAADRANDGRTQILRGKPAVARGQFEQDPVVGWVVVVGGPGLGSFRPIYEGNNTVGRSGSQRIPLDFGDDAISSEEQAYIRYDSAERSFLFVPNLAKTNIVSVNGKRPTTAVSLASMDVILMGRTQLVFVPFCGAEFDWSELSDKQS
jgi:FHA domain